jgi:hypothetical protein
MAKVLFFSMTACVRVKNGRQDQTLPGQEGLRKERPAQSIKVMVVLSKKSRKCQ